MNNYFLTTTKDGMMVRIANPSGFINKMNWVFIDEYNDLNISINKPDPDGDFYGLNSIDINPFSWEYIENGNFLKTINPIRYEKGFCVTVEEFFGKRLE